MTRLLRPLPLDFSPQVFTRLGQKYLQVLPAGLAGMVCYVTLIILFLVIEPSRVRDVFLTNSYAPVILLAALAHFFFWSFVFLNTRRGSLASFFLTSLFFLQLQQVLTSQIVVQLAFVTMVSEIFCVLLLFIWKKIRSRLAAHRARFSPTQESYRSSGEREKTEIPLSTRHRRHGRQRKHHFFGK